MWLYPGRVEDPRAVDPLRDERGVPDCRRDARLSRRAAASTSRPSRRRRHGRRSSISPGHAETAIREQRAPRRAERRAGRDRPALGMAYLRRELRRRRGAASPCTSRSASQESDELYLLSLESDASVKVRDGLMDVKQLESVDGDGLEQWRPVLKDAFPLAADSVGGRRCARRRRDGARRARRTRSSSSSTTSSRPNAALTPVARPQAACRTTGRRRAWRSCPS